MPTEPIPNPKPRETPSQANGGKGESGGPKFILTPSGPEAIAIGMPREIGPYSIQRLIGSGGMATVYAALQKQPRRTVALKVMKAGIAQSRGEAALRRFKREIEILGKLHHPYIAAVYDAGTFDDGAGEAPYFVMEYISGALNILEYIAKQKMNLRDQLKLFVKVCAAVEHGHSHKVIHRDLKPGNILIDQYGEPKIIDFGIAHAAEVDSSQQTMTTEAGNLVGTLQYMAPEQVDTRPQDLDGRCDVYALGVLLYKMTTGKPPYDLEALPVFEAIRVIREEKPRRPGEINSETKGDLETIILKSMERDRARRYRNAGSLGRDIVRYLASKPINARRASLAYRTRLFVKRNAVVLGVMAVIAIVAAAALGYTTWERQRIKRQQAELDQQRIAIDEAGAQIQNPVAPPIAEPTIQPFTLAQHTGRINELAFLQGEGGRLQLASASNDHQLLLWDVESKQAVQRFDPIDRPVTFVAASADGSIIAAAGDQDGEAIVVLRCADGQVLHTIRDADGATSLALSASGTHIGFGASNLTLTMREVGANSRDTRSLRSSSGAFTAIAMSRDDELVAAGTAGGSVMVWQPRPPSGQPVEPMRLTGLSHAIVAIAFIERDEARGIIALAENGRAFTWWNEPNEWRGSGWSAAALPLIDATFSANGAYLATLTADGAQAWEIGDGTSAPRRIGDPVKLDDPPSSVAIDDDGRWIAQGAHDGDVHVNPIPQVN